MLSENGITFVRMWLSLQIKKNMVNFKKMFSTENEAASAYVTLQKSLRS